MRVYREGRVALANAPGTGVADDKAIYAYVEKIIRYYLDQDPILRNVPTYVCAEQRALAYVLEHLDELVVKATDGAGGYGMLVGPHSTPRSSASSSPSASEAESARLHRAADALAVARADDRRRPDREPARRPPPVRALRAARSGCSRAASRASR